MKYIGTTLLACFIICVSGCKNVPTQVTRGLSSIKPPKGSVISYACLPAETTLLASGINRTSARYISNSCYVVFIDEQPKYDYAHGLHLLLVADDGTITTLFHGSGFPDFPFQQKDGSWIRPEWKQY